MNGTTRETPDPVAEWLHFHAQRCPRLPLSERLEAGVFWELWGFRCPLCGEHSPPFHLPRTPRRGGARDY